MITLLWINSFDGACLVSLTFTETRCLNSLVRLFARELCLMPVRSRLVIVINTNICQLAGRGTATQIFQCNTY